MKHLIAAGIIGAAGYYAMSYAFNNLSGTNNQLAAGAGAAAGLAYLALNKVGIA